MQLTPFRSPIARRSKLARKLSVFDRWFPMKEILPSMPAERHNEQDFANRRLIRPALNHSNHAAPSHGPTPSAGREKVERSNGARKAPPPDQTNAENFYYQKQMQSKTPMVIVLSDGEEIHGTVEWYDKTCIKVNRNGSPNLMIYKPSIKYLYKEGEGKK
jgi:host factor-I protein